MEISFHEQEGKHLSRLEELIGKSKLVGNFSDEEEESHDPKKDIFSVELDEVKEYVLFALFA